MRERIGWHARRSENKNGASEGLLVLAGSNTSSGDGYGVAGNG